MRHRRIFAYHYAAPPLDRDELRTIRDHMVARGPDGLGEWFADNGRVGFGQPLRDRIVKTRHKDPKSL